MKYMKSIVTVLVLSSTLFAGNGNRGTSSVTNTQDTSATTVSAQVTYPLSYEQQSMMEFMYQEEKVARDVYLNMYAKYGVDIFKNISESEQQHMDAIKTLLDKYSLNVAINEAEVGTFVNLELQEMYDQLMEQGNVSLTEALKVGQAIEIADIEDLDTAIAVANPDAVIVYERLRLGSESHLASFTKLLESSSTTRRGR
jgi:hypothetical protein